MEKRMVFRYWLSEILNTGLPELDKKFAKSIRYFSLYVRMFSPKHKRQF